MVITFISLWMIFSIVTCLNTDILDSSRFEEVLRWKQLIFRGVSSENYIPYNNLPLGVEHYNCKIFIGVPRLQRGVPATLSTVCLEEASGNKSPDLVPFPDLETNSLPVVPDPNRIISVYRPRIDECDRLWFIDTGALDYETLTQFQRPSIWVWNLKTNKREWRYEIPIDITDSGSGFISITVDVDPTDCGNAFAYIPNWITGKMYIYSLAQDRMWTFTHNYFYRSPLEGDIKLGDLKYQWDDQLFSITLGPRQSDGYRDVYFHPMITTNEFFVSSKVLQDSNLAARSYQEDDFKLLGNRGPLTQSAMHHFDIESGVMFYAEIARNAIGCWNSRTPFNSYNHGIVAKDDQTMIYPTDLKVDSNGTVWVLTNGLPIFFYSELDPNEYNFRVWRAKVSDLIRGTVCQ